MCFYLSFDNLSRFLLLLSSTEHKIVLMSQTTLLLSDISRSHLHLFSVSSDDISCKLVLYYHRTWFYPSHLQSSLIRQDLFKTSISTFLNDLLSYIPLFFLSHHFVPNSKKLALLPSNLNGKWLDLLGDLPRINPWLLTPLVKPNTLEILRFIPTTHPSTYILGSQVPSLDPTPICKPSLTVYLSFRSFKPLSLYPHSHLPHFYFPPSFSLLVVSSNSSLPNTPFSFESSYTTGSAKSFSSLTSWLYLRRLSNPLYSWSSVSSPNCFISSIHWNCFRYDHLPLQTILVQGLSYFPLFYW